jgi:hypothetical protein
MGAKRTLRTTLNFRELATPGGLEPPTLSLEVFGTFNDFNTHSDKFLLHTWLDVAVLFLFVGIADPVLTWTF